MWQEVINEQNALIQKINNLSLDEKVNLVREIVEDPEFNYTYKCVIELNKIKESLLDKKYDSAKYFQPVQFAFDDFEAAGKSISTKAKLMQKHAEDGIDHYPELGKTILRFIASYELARKYLNSTLQKIRTECPILCGCVEEMSK